MSNNTETLRAANAPLNHEIGTLEVQMKPLSFTKEQRLSHANELIKIIAARGRRFFFSESTGRTAELLIGPRGRVFFLDEYTGTIIYTHKTAWANKWRGFSHGGTLRGLVEMMRDYIVKGEPIPEYYIGPERGQLTDGNIWGYAPDAMQSVRNEALKLPIIMKEASHE